MDDQRLFCPTPRLFPRHCATRSARFGLLLLMGCSLAQAQGIFTEQPSSETRPSSRANPVSAPIPAEEPEGLQSATAQNNSVRPEKLEHSEDLLQQIQLPEGFSISIFAQDLTNPRIIERSEEHTSELQSRPHLVC